MTAASALTRGRRAAEGLMVDMCTVTRPGATTGGTLDEDTGQYTGGTGPPTIYTGRCRLQNRGMGSSTGTNVAGAEWVEQHTVLQVPVDEDGSADIRTGDLFELTASSHNPSMAGRRYDVGRHLSDKTHATKREFMLTEAGVTL